jgi:hypothetical protein
LGWPEAGRSRPDRLFVLHIHFKDSDRKTLLAGEAQ